jgi:putative transposase
MAKPTGVFSFRTVQFSGLRSALSGERRLKQLEEENAKLKKVLAEAMLDNPVLKDITSRKW